MHDCMPVKTKVYSSVVRSYGLKTFRCIFHLLICSRMRRWSGSRVMMQRIENFNRKRYKSLLSLQYIIKF